MAFTLNESDATKLELMMADKTIKLKLVYKCNLGTFLTSLYETYQCRFKTTEDATLWRDGMITWKDWAIDYG